MSKPMRWTLLGATSAAVLAFLGVIASAGIVTQSGPRLYASSSSSSSSSGGGRLVGDEIAAMTNGVSDGPNYGLSGYGGESNCGTDVAITRIATGGPDNRPYLRYVITTSIAEFGCTWTIDSPYGNPASPTITRGQSMFMRASYKAITSTDQTQKFFETNHGTGDSRSITVVKQWDDPSNNYVISQGLDGGDIPITGSLLTTGNWYNIQVEVRFSNPENTANGYHKVWINNDTYASPDYFDNNIVVDYRSTDTPGEEYVALSGYHQGTVNPGREFHIADFRLGPTFDASWHSSGPP